MPSTVVVTVNYNGLEDTLRCLRSLAAIRDPETGVVVIDNASAEDPTGAILEEAPNCRFVRLAENTGWAGGNNVGLRIALDELGADRVLLLNNDTVVDPTIITLLRAAEDSSPDYGIIGPVICFMDEAESVMTDGCLFNRPDSRGFFGRKVVPLATTGPPDLTEVDIVNGCAMMLSARVVREIGPIDERFFLIHEESDYCLRARRAGFRCGVLGKALVWHKGSSSFKKAGRSVQRYYDARNLFLLLRKHLGSTEGTRGVGASWMEFSRYAYYRYCIEREHGQSEAADGVIHGLCDAISGRWGGLRPRRRPEAAAIRMAFDAARHLRDRTAAMAGPR